MAWTGSRHEATCRAWLLSLLILPAGACRRDASEQEAIRAESAGRVRVEQERWVLHAQRVTELHLGSIEGPVVARAHPGATLEVVSMELGVVRLLLPGFTHGTDRRPIELYGPASGFGASPVAAEPPWYPASTRMIRNMLAWEVEPTPGSPPFASTFCGDAYIVNQTPGHIQIAQEHRGVELLGWLDQGFAAMKRGVVACTSRVIERQPDGRLRSRHGSTSEDWQPVSEIPAHYVTHGAPPGRKLHEVMEHGQTVYWLVINASQQALCRPWTFHTNQANPTDGVWGMDERLKEIPFFQRPGYAGFRAHLEGDELKLYGPYFSSKPWKAEGQEADVGGYKCAYGLGYLGATDQALRFERFGARHYVAWHPDEEERWYLSRPDCERAASLAREALRQNPWADPPGGAHRDCGQELIE